MDTPLLALTRRRYASRGGPSADSVAVENMRQLVQLRWIAVFGQLITIVAVHAGLGVPLPLAWMLGVTALLAIANLIATVLLARGRVTNIAIMLALLFDIAALTAQLHLSGGTTNPFISFYLLQIALAAILLDIWSAWILLIVTSLCFAALTVGGRPLALPPVLQAHRVEIYALGALISFALTAGLLGLFITRITRNLRARDRYLADLRQHAAEEDGIVRMGLFASGAAHELGTPLASLSVILSDWRRMPRLAADPELSGELAEMQAEVERCKAIVTDILHSAGEPQIEATEKLHACAFLDDVVAAWRPTHPMVSLEFSCTGLEDAMIVAGASLRQAIWNLLDNAAEVSPDRVDLFAERANVNLALTVIDEGPGFAEVQLPLIGTPYQSSKGAGHGIGLFLAATVARRMGGHLEAENRPAGGASVRLVLPLGRGARETR